MTQQHDQKQGRSKSWVFPAVSGALLAATLVVAGVVSGGQQSQLDEQQERISELTASVDQVQVSAQQARDEATASLLGAELDRKAADLKPIEDLVGAALTWSSQAEYDAARKAIIDRHGLAEDGQFLSVFMPPAPVNYDSQGNAYYYIDASGLNSRMGALDTRLISVDGVDYTYLVTASQQSTSSDGKGVSSNLFVARVTVGGEGEIVSAIASATTTAPRASG